MEKKSLSLLITTLALVLLLLPEGAQGATIDSYTRDPSGFTVESPMSFDFTLSSLNTSEYTEFRIFTTDGEYFSECFDNTSTTQNFDVLDVVLDAGEYTGVFQDQRSDSGCTVSGSGGSALEYDSEDPIFEVLAPPAPTLTLSTDPVQNVLLAGFLMIYTASYVRRLFYS